MNGHETSQRPRLINNVGGGDEITGIAGVLHDHEWQDAGLDFEVRAEHFPDASAKLGRKLRKAGEGRLGRRGGNVIAVGVAAARVGVAVAGLFGLEVKEAQLPDTVAPDHGEEG